MARMLTSEEMESVRLTEAARDKRTPLEKAAATTLQPTEGMVKLYDPRYTNYKYGSDVGSRPSDNLIVFGTVEPHVAIVRADHQLLPALLKKRGNLVVLRPGEKPGRTYACEVCDAEFPSKARLSTHRAEAHAPAEEERPAPKPRTAPRPVAKGKGAPKAPPPGSSVEDADEAEEDQPDEADDDQAETPGS